MANSNFIRTSDKETAEKLRECGLYEIPNTGTKYFTFVNNPIMNFDNKDIELEKIKYTNNLCI